MFSKLRINPKQIEGYADERTTHSDVARAVADGSADVGLGLETAGLAYGLDFVFLNRERYDLILPTEAADQPVFQKLIAWLASEAGKQFVGRHKGYESQDTGSVQIVG
jgi:putative molybdopterin biosynthesis protein